MSHAKTTSIIVPLLSIPLLLSVISIISRFFYKKLEVDNESHKYSYNPFHKFSSDNFYDGFYSSEDFDDFFNSCYYGFYSNRDFNGYYNHSYNNSSKGSYNNNYNFSPSSPSYYTAYDIQKMLENNKSPKEILEFCQNSKYKKSDNEIKILQDCLKTSVKKARDIYGENNEWQNLSAYISNLKKGKVD